MAKLLGKNVLVTGASSGIGEAIAIRFGQEGANVAVNYFSNAANGEAVRQKVESAAAQVKGAKPKTVLVGGDISQEEQVKKIFAETIDAFGSLDILINNAGIQMPTASHEIKTADYDRIVGVNLRGAFLCAREAIQHFLAKRKGGVIVNNSSVHQIIPKPKYLPYSISKGGLGNMTMTLALEYADRGIRVNSVAPGATVSPINRAWIDDAKARAEVESHIPMGRAGTAEEMAAAFLFLASDDASYITGQTLYVCGGLTLYPEFRVAWSSGE
ncbi:MAG TPA: glucose 1-dehydrogenase [Bryobacteraceae bacterium]|nr:glucose 1-dehydrogenase [Bryobacteraceae bacterium]